MKNSNHRTPPKGIFPADAQKPSDSGMPHDMGGHNGSPVKNDTAEDFHTRDKHVGEVVIGQKK